MTTRVPFVDLDRDELDRQLSPSRSAKDPWGVLARHEAVTAALVSGDGLTVTREIAYGPGASQTFDLFVPTSRRRAPCVVHFHGGFWQEGSKATSGYLVPAVARHGCAVAGVGYTLAPEARLRAIVDEAARALVHLQRHAASYGLDPARLIVSGHSAGGHLAAALLAGQGGAAAAGAVAGAVLVSGVYDLAPVAASYVNDKARIDDDEVRDLSPLMGQPGRDVPVHVLVGADEPDAFVHQFDALCRDWAPHVTRLTAQRAPGRDHFDVLDELTDTDSATFRALEEMTA